MAHWGLFRQIKKKRGMSSSYVCALTREVVHWPVVAKEPVRSQDNPCEIFVVRGARNKHFCNYFGFFY